MASSRSRSASVKSIAADHSMYTVFSTDDGTLTYAAYNPGDSSITVSFSDGTSLEVEANALAVTTDDEDDENDDEDDDEDDDSGESSPSIDQFDVADTSRGPWTRFNVEWAVSDPDSDLDLVEIEMIDDSGTVVDSTSTAVSGDSASGEDSVRERNGGGEYEIKLTATDEAGNSATETKTVAAA
ncbi:hypothetical protein ACLI4U_10870 [Natrialbaceae archaeon A-CW2]